MEQWHAFVLDAMGMHFFFHRNERFLQFLNYSQLKHWLGMHCAFWKQTTHKFYEPRPNNNNKNVGPKFSYARTYTHIHCIRPVNAPRKDPKKKKKRYRNKLIQKKRFSELRNSNTSSRRIKREVESNVLMEIDHIPPPFYFPLCA